MSRVRPDPADGRGLLRLWRALAPLARLWPWLLAAAALGYAGSTYDWRAVGPALGRIPIVAFVLTGAVLIIACFVLAAVRWIVTAGITVHGASSFLEVYGYTSLASAIGQNTPLQVGEALKLRFARVSGTTLGRSTTGLVFERAIDLAVIADLAISGVIFRRSEPLGLLSFAPVVPVLGVFCLPFALRFVDRILRRRGYNGLPEGSDGWFTAGRLGILLVLTGLKWLLVAVMWQRAMAFVGCRIDLTDAMLTVSTVTIVSTLSLVPGGFGIQELSLKAMLVSLGIEPEVAEAGSVAVRLLTPIMIGLGVVHMPALLIGRAHEEARPTP